MNGVSEGVTVETAEDLQAVLDAAEVACSFLAEINRDNEYLPNLLFQAIAEKTRTLAAAGVPLSNITFNSNDLAEYMPTIGNIRKTFSNDAERTKWVSAQWRKLEKQLPEHLTGLQQHARNLQKSWLPTLEKIQSPGGAGQFTLYRLSTMPAESATAETYSPLQAAIGSTPLDCHADSIEYTTARAGKLPPWARWLENFELIGHRHRRFKLLFCAGYFPLMTWAIISIHMWLIHWLGNTPRLWQIQVFYYGLIPAIILAIFVIPFIRISIYKVIPSPFMLTGFQCVDGLLLELSRADGRHRVNPQSPRRFRLTVYSASCPICGGYVGVEGGGWRYPGRLIGRCYEAPREHLWSFDHVTRSGRRLR